jgi:uncharacterized damage-inducible protein DinB
MKISQELLIDDLRKDIEVLIACVGFFKDDTDALLIQPIPGQWSVAQVLEHLNSYGRYYLPAIDKAMSFSNSQREAWFNSGVLGNYFTNMMKPKTVFEVKNKMKAPKDHSPQPQLDADKVIEEFLEQQQRLLRQLEAAKNKSLGSIRVPISITKLLKLKLGDTFRFLIAHEQRHFIQARNTLRALGIATDKFPAILRGV